MTDDYAFRIAVEIVLEHEGGYVNDPDDPGGETKFGISKRTYPSLDIRALTREEAIEIYRIHWWEHHGYGRLGAPVVCRKVFDLAVNMGHTKAVRLLQRALKACGRPIAEDGVIGPETLTALERADALQIIVGLRCEAANRYRRLAENNPRLARFLKGWLKRAYE